MGEFDNKYKERWNDRRKSGYNWKKLLLMILLLVGIFIVIKRMDNFGQSKARPAAEVIDSTAAPTPDSVNTSK